MRGRLDILRFQYTLLSKLYSTLCSFYLPCASHQPSFIEINLIIKIITDHYFPEFTNFGTLLSRKELRCIRNSFQCYYQELHPEVLWQYIYIRFVYELYSGKQVGLTRSSAQAPKASLEKSQQLILETFNHHLLKDDPKYAWVHLLFSFSRAVGPCLLEISSQSWLHQSVMTMVDLL